MIESIGFFMISLSFFETKKTTSKYHNDRVIKTIFLRLLILGIISFLI